MTVMYSDFKNQLLKEIKQDVIEFHKEDYFAMLLRPGYQPKASHKFSDVENYEFQGDNYTAGGQPIVLKVTKLQDGIKFNLQGQDIEWKNITGSVESIFIYQVQDGVRNPVIYQRLSLEKPIYKENLFIHWSDFYVKATTVKPSPVEPPEAEIISSVLGKGVLGRIILGQAIIRKE